MKSKMLKTFIAGISLALGITVINPASASAEWRQDSNGWWNSEEDSYSIGWKQIDNSWYYFGSDGYMKTGWFNDNGSWYYFQPSGSMKTGWFNDNGTWYYLQSSGAMKTGWLNDNGTWYYLNDGGAMQTGLLTLNDKTYYLNESGAMVTGDITLNGVKYTFNEKGEKISSTNTVNDSKDTNANAATTTNNNNSNNSTTAAEENKVSSGGGGGGGASSKDNKEDKKDSKFASYSDLYGKWTISSYIKDSGMNTSLSQQYIDMAVGETFTISENSIYHVFYSVSNPSVKEKVLTDSEFKSKFGTSLSKLGISDDKVNCITVSGSAQGKNKTVYIITTSDNDVFAIISNAAFKIEKA